MQKISTETSDVNCSSLLRLSFEIADHVLARLTELMINEDELTNDGSFFFRKGFLF